MKIKFYDKDDPTLLARIGKILMFLGGLIMVIEYSIMSLGGGQIMEMQIVWFDLMPSFFPISAIGIIVLLVGWSISHLKWRTGELHLTDSSLKIKGKQTVMIPYNSNVELYEFHKHPNQLKIKSRIYNNLTLRFESEEEQKLISTKLDSLI